MNRTFIITFLILIILFTLIVNTSNYKKEGLPMISQSLKVNEVGLQVKNGLNWVMYIPYLGFNNMEHFDFSNGDFTPQILGSNAIDGSQLSVITGNKLIESDTFVYNNGLPINDSNKGIITTVNPYRSNLPPFTLEITGIFLPSVTGYWQFFTCSDDASYLWLGNLALSGYSSSNASINNGKTHNFVLKMSDRIYMVAASPYPIRIIYGNNRDKFNLSFGFLPPNGSWTTNGNGYFFNNTNILSSLNPNEKNYILT